MKFLELDLTSGLIRQSTTEATSTPTSGTIPIADDNGKLDSWTTPYTVSAPLTISNFTISLPKADDSTDGYLSSTDWSTFNDKENNLGLPTTDGQILSSDTAGNRSWIDPPSGGSVGGVYGINVEALTGDKTLTPGVDPIYQYLDPNGAYRTITLDTTNASAGDRFIIRNNGSSTTYCLKIQQGSNQIGWLCYQSEAEFVFDGSNWSSSNDVNHQYATQIGYGTKAYSSGVAIGGQASGYVQGVGVGTYAKGYNYGTGVGYYASAYTYGTALGCHSYGSFYGIGIGYHALGINYGVAVGYYSNGRNNGLSIGYKAGYGISPSLNPNQNLFIGYQAGINVKTADTWQASTAYNVGDYVNPTSWNGYSYKCIVAGTSGSTEPTWPTTIGDTVTDGTVTWECVSVRGNNNLYIGYDIEGQQNDTNQLNIGNLIYGDLNDKYLSLPTNVNAPPTFTDKGSIYVASDGNLHYVGKEDYIVAYNDYGFFNNSRYTLGYATSGATFTIHAGKAVVNNKIVSFDDYSYTYTGSDTVDVYHYLDESGNFITLTVTAGDSEPVAPDNSILLARTLNTTSNTVGTVKLTFGNIFYGLQAGKNLHLGYGNVLLGNNAGINITDGNYNTFINSSGTGTTTGSYNVAIGISALYSNQTGSYNIAISPQALQYVKGSHNIGLGYFSGRYLADGTSLLTSANDSIFIGSYTKALNNSSNNEIVIGYYAVGNGSNTVTIGNSSITDTFLKGNLHLTSVSTAPSTPSSGGILYVDSSGNLHYLGVNGTDTQLASA